MTKEISRRNLLKATGMTAASAAFIPLSSQPSDVLCAGQGQNAHQEKWVQSSARKNVKFDKLLEPGNIGKIKIKNRMVKSAAGSSIWDEEKKQYNPPGVAFYEAIAKGGVGAIFVDNPAWDPIWPSGRPFYSDEFIKDESQIVDVIRKYDVPVFLQFYSMINFFEPLLAASPVNFPAKLDFNNALPKEMTIDDIRRVQDALVSASVRAQKTGYDGIEINAGCSHLFDSFLSRFFNKRTDQYGPQSIENQARIVVEMIQQVKESCGSDFVVSVLINGFEMNVDELGNQDDCFTVQESAALAKEFETAGADFIHVRSGVFGDHPKGFLSDLWYLTGEANNSYGFDIDIKKFWPEFVTDYGGNAGFIDTAAVIKQAVSIPVMTVSGMDPRLLPDVAENAIRDGKIDFAGINRPLYADPELPNKIIAGEIDDIIPCTHCYTCFEMGNASGKCRVNVAYQRATGDEMPEGYDVQPAEVKKKVLVVGAGPAGMEAARVAALRGHQVTLYEKSRRLGGLMPLAAMVKGEHEKILDFVTYLSNQVEKLGVDVKLGQTVDLSVVEKDNPDVVIVANGGSYTSPNIPGINHPKVITNADLHGQLEAALSVFDPMTLRWLTNFYLPVGEKAVIIGGKLQGVQVAELLVQRGKDVTIVDEAPLEDLAGGIPGTVGERLVYYLRTRGVKILMGIKYNEITNKGLSITTTNGLETTFEADNIVLALPLAPNKGLAESLKGRVNEVYAVGDCNEPGVMETSIASANLTARKI